MPNTSIEKLCRTKEKALLQSFGLNCQYSSSDSEYSDDMDEETCGEAAMQSVADMTRLVKDCEFNFFEVLHRIGDAATTVELIVKVDELDITATEKKKFKIFHEAFLAEEDINSVQKKRQADQMNGLIVTESESDDPGAIQNASSVMDESIREIVTKKRNSITRAIRRRRAKRIAEQNFLCKKQTKRVNTILCRYPDIGTTIENFVKDNNVGAEAWRRTGVLTFDGNIKNTQKVTYSSIKQHLEEVYAPALKISYGTVVQLCVARNKRRISSLRYKGVAQVTSRRARKGFQLRYNPDFHWSNALYRGLDYIQLEDGSDITIVNRDDASGFRLDTLATHKQYTSPVVAGSEVLTTHTDYVNRYPSVLQTSSYNFPRTRTTPELCAGVVKAVPLHQKNPAQHASDFRMLMGKEELTSACYKQNGKAKNILCVRVDGASDEGPSHDEVQFFWTLDHFKNSRLVTLVTARSSGSSYLNRVELQNGCLTRGHSNVFIPSTMSGSCMEAGKINQDVLRKNLDLAIDVYIERVNNSPCGDTFIQLFKGSDSNPYQEYRVPLKVFLKGSKKKKCELRSQQPDLFQLFEDIWHLRERHMIKGYPAQHVYQLCCCFQNDCSHPLCKEKVGFNIEKVRWFAGGPPVNKIPLPVPDPSRPWGDQNCPTCKVFCAGHYLKPVESLQSDSVPCEPPSSVIQSIFKQSHASATVITDDGNTARQVLLPTEEVNIWFKHLQTVSNNRKKGAQKAVQTRQAKTTPIEPEAPETDVVYCGKCGEAYEEETDEIQNWIACDVCSNWFH